MQRCITVTKSILHRRHMLVWAVGSGAAGAGALLAAARARAQPATAVHRCTTARGSVTYTNQGCQAIGPTVRQQALDVDDSRSEADRRAAQASADRLAAYAARARAERLADAQAAPQGPSGIAHASARRAENEAAARKPRPTRMRGPKRKRTAARASPP
jgi:succinate dehydrogenase/fumarate reductase flavoprotein subunit